MKNKPKLLLLISFVLGVLLASVADAQQACPRCGRVHRQNTNVANSYQAEAMSEATQMAQRRFKGHVRGVIAGVAFCGVGWSSSPNNVPTCTPRRGMQLVADATVRGSDGYYRVRYWR